MIWNWWLLANRPTDDQKWNFSLFFRFSNTIFPLFHFVQHEYLIFLLLACINNADCFERIFPQCENVNGETAGISEKKNYYLLVQSWIPNINPIKIGKLLLISNSSARSICKIPTTQHFLNDVLRFCAIEYVLRWNCSLNLNIGCLSIYPFVCLSAMNGHEILYHFAIYLFHFNLFLWKLI